MLGVLAWGDAGWGDELALGLFITLQLAIASFALGLILGALGAAAKLSGNRPAATVADMYTTIGRGVPELLVIYLVFYGGGYVVSATAGLLGNRDAVELGAFGAGVIALGTVQGAYATEVLRAAIAAIPRGQVEAARALGLNTTLLYRRILLPQLLRFALPGLGNLWLALLKETALVSIIGLEDLLRASSIAIGVTRMPFTFYFAVASAYLLLTVASLIYLRWAEARSMRHLRSS